jgi:hypothetical protein
MTFHDGNVVVPLVVASLELYRGGPNGESALALVQHSELGESASAKGEGNLPLPDEAEAARRLVYTANEVSWMSLDETYPRKRPADPFWWQEERAPSSVSGCGSRR